MRFLNSHCSHCGAFIPALIYAGFIQGCSLMQRFFFGFFLCSLLSACCCNTSRDGYWVTDQVQCRSGYDVEWQKTCEMEAAAKFQVSNFLKDELTVEDVVQIALLNNPSIQSQFESIGVSRAQYLTAMTPRNPLVFWEVRRQTNPFSPVLDIQWSVTAFIWDLFLIPLKTRAAGTALEQQELEVAQMVMDLILQVKTAFYQLQITESKYLTLKLHLFENQEDQFSEDVADRIRYQNDLVEYFTAEIEVLKLKEALNQLMGFECSSDAWEIDLTLPPYHQESLSLEHCMEMALCNRLELQHNRVALRLLLEQAKLQRWWTIFDPQIGPTQEFNPDSTIESGFAMTHTLPLFNWNQGNMQQIYFQCRQLWHQYQMARIEISTKVRLAYIQLKKIQELLTLFENDIFPLFALSHDSEKEDDEKSEKLDALEVQYSELLRDYWIHHAELEHAIGGELFLAETI